MTEYRQGDLIYVRLLGHGHVQGGNRPAIVVSNNMGNLHSGTLIVAPCTTKSKKPIPTHAQFTFKKRDGRLVKNTVLCEQLVTVDKREVTKKLGKLGFGVLEEVRECLSVSLGLPSTMSTSNN